jgi:hypothetical protein
MLFDVCCVAENDEEFGDILWPMMRRHQMMVKGTVHFVKKTIKIFIPFNETVNENGDFHYHF